MGKRSRKGAVSKGKPKKLSVAKRFALAAAARAKAEKVLAARKPKPKPKARKPPSRLAGTAPKSKVRKPKVKPRRRSWAAAFAAAQEQLIKVEKGRKKKRRQKYRERIMSLIAEATHNPRAIAEPLDNIRFESGRIIANDYAGVEWRYYTVSREGERSGYWTARSIFVNLGTIKGGGAGGPVPPDLEAYEDLFFDEETDFDIDFSFDGEDDVA